MTCPLDPCQAPLCKGATWCAKERSAGNLAAFTLEVAREMRLNDRDLKKALKTVEARWAKEPCVFT